MDFREKYIDRWRSLVERLGNLDQDELFEYLVEKYSEKHRTYHNLDHLDNCLRHFTLIEDRLISSDLTEFALWMHDIYYNTKSERNEEASAIYAKKTLTKMGAALNDARKVHDLILATKHDLKIIDSDSKYLNDIDIAILGEEEDIFLEYEKNIRKEYKWVPFFYYKKRRFEILEGFISKKFIYHTDFFRERFEIKARKNLNSVLKIYRKIYS